MSRYRKCTEMSWHALTADTHCPHHSSRWPFFSAVFAFARLSGGRLTPTSRKMHECGQSPESFRRWTGTALQMWRTKHHQPSIALSSRVASWGFHARFDNPSSVQQQGYPTALRPRAREVNFAIFASDPCPKMVSSRVCEELTVADGARMAGDCLF